MKELIIKLATIYDQLGQIKKADRLDAFLQKFAEDEIEPTPEDLYNEEQWLKDEFPEVDDDPLAGLEGDDLKAAELYLQGMDPEDIKQQLAEIREEQQEILRQLSQLLSQKDVQPDMLPHQMPIIPEASLFSDFQKLANMLDEKKLHKQADKVEKFLTKMAQGLPPDDFDSDDFEFDDEPTTDELEKIDSEYENRFLDLIQKLAEGKFSSLEEAQEEAIDVLRLYDEEFGIPQRDSLSEFDTMDSMPDNVITFPDTTQK